MKLRRILSHLTYSKTPSTPYAFFFALCRLYPYRHFGGFVAFAIENLGYVINTWGQCENSGMTDSPIIEKTKAAMRIARNISAYLKGETTQHFKAIRLTYLHLLKEFDKELKSLIKLIKDSDVKITHEQKQRMTLLIDELRQARTNIHSFEYYIEMNSEKIKEYANTTLDQGLARKRFDGGLPDKPLNEPLLTDLDFIPEGAITMDPPAVRRSPHPAKTKKKKKPQEDLFEIDLSWVKKHTFSTPYVFAKALEKHHLSAKGLLSTIREHLENTKELVLKNKYQAALLLAIKKGRPVESVDRKKIQDDSKRIKTIQDAIQLINDLNLAMQHKGTHYFAIVRLYYLEKCEQICDALQKVADLHKSKTALLPAQKDPHTTLYKENIASLQFILNCIEANKDALKTDAATNHGLSIVESESKKDDSDPFPMDEKQSFEPTIVVTPIQKEKEEVTAATEPTNEKIKPKRQVQFTDSVIHRDEEKNGPLTQPLDSTSSPDDTKYADPKPTSRATHFKTKKPTSTGTGAPSSTTSALPVPPPLPVTTPSSSATSLTKNGKQNAPTGTFQQILTFHQVASGSAISSPNSLSSPPANPPKPKGFWPRFKLFGSMSETVAGIAIITLIVTLSLTPGLNIGLGAAAGLFLLMGLGYLTYRAYTHFNPPPPPVALASFDKTSTTFIQSSTPAVSTPQLVETANPAASTNTPVNLKGNTAKKIGMFTPASTKPAPAKRTAGVNTNSVTPQNSRTLH